EAVQRSFGRFSLEGVQAHIGGTAIDAARAIGAVAYATNGDVVFRERPDLRTAAHEAAHVVQQRAGVSLRDGVGEANYRHEGHAAPVRSNVVGNRSRKFLPAQYPPRTAARKAVPRIDPPIAAPAPSTAIGIRAFIELVEAEEARWPAAEQTQTALMISRLRKI